MRVYSPFTCHHSGLRRSGVHHSCEANRCCCCCCCCCWQLSDTSLKQQQVSVVSCLMLWCSQFSIIVMIIFNIRLSQLSAPRRCLGHCVVKTRYRAHCSLPARLAACVVRECQTQVCTWVFSPLTAPALVPGPARLLARVSGRRCPLQPGWWDSHQSGGRHPDTGHSLITHDAQYFVITILLYMGFVTLHHYADLGGINTSDGPCDHVRPTHVQKLGALTSWSQ